MPPLQRKTLTLRVVPKLRHCQSQSPPLSSLPSATTLEVSEDWKIIHKTKFQSISIPLLLSLRRGFDMTCWASGIYLCKVRNYFLADKIRCQVRIRQCKYKEESRLLKRSSPKYLQRLTDLTASRTQIIKTMGKDVSLGNIQPTNKILMAR